MTLDPLGISGHDLGDYRVEGYRGTGAFSFVYDATHDPSGNEVALKILKPGAAWPQQREFDNEGSLLLRMTGASAVVDILGTGTDSVKAAAPFPYPLRYHVLERAEDCLTALLADPTLLDWPARLKLYRDVVLGVHQMHNRNLVHRDIKAANCLIFPDGIGLRAKISDLGRSRDLALPASAPANHYTFGRGDPNFSPPELLSGLGDDTSITHRSADLYGLGSLLYELTIGQGITATALTALSPALMVGHTYPPDQRRALYRARIAELRGLYQPAFELFNAATPRSIRLQIDRLVRQLCDPDPFIRLQRVAVGKRAVTPKELSWLLNRVDMLRLTMKNDLAQARRLNARRR